MTHSDCIAYLRTLPDASVDSCVTDPPYELGFMGKKWDSSGIAYSVELWREVLRALKPGAHLLAFGGTRTHHRMVCAIEDAGFEIRDEMQWLYGSGFPKSLDVSKAIDKAAGAERPDAIKGGHMGAAGRSHGEDYINAGAAVFEKTIPAIVGKGALTRGTPQTNAAKQWDGWGTALKPACEPICVARKPLEGTVAQNTLKHGAGGINVDGCRVEFGDGPKGTWGATQNSTSPFIANTGTPTVENPKGRWPANVILSHAEGCVCTGTKRVKGSDAGVTRTTAEGWGMAKERRNVKHADADGLETVEAWDCAPECPVRLLDAQSGELTSGQPMNRMHTDPGRAVASGASKGGVYLHQGFGDTGGASRFFYTAKASKSDREHFNTHATVKPLALMRYLVRLVTPPGGVVLDMFAGSGTTLVAARQEGFRFLGCDADEGHVRIAQDRLALELPFET